jgi:hypothetical protein
MNPLHPALTRELAAAHIHNLRAAADFERATRRATDSAPRSRRRTGQCLVAVGRRARSWRREPVRPCA